MEDLFTILFKYRKEENRFTSVIFVFLKRLWERKQDHQCCITLLEELCSLKITNSDALEFEIQEPKEIHKKTNGKRKIVPDLVIRSKEPSKRLLILLEVKDESKAGKSQVKDYIEYLKKRRDYKERRLVLLSNNRYTLDTIKGLRLLNKVKLIKVNWSKLFILLRGLQPEVRDTVNIFILDCLIDYLKEKGMVDLTRITKEEFENNIKQFVSFLAMLREAVEDAFPKSKYIELDLGSTIYIGVQFKKRPYFSVGICVNQPGELQMHTRRAGISNQRLSRAISNKTVKEDDFFGEIYAYRSLSQVYKESDPHKQKEMMKKFINEMYPTLNELRNK